jgi:hypothetical protein
MEIIAAGNEITLLLVLGFGILSVWDMTANAHRALRSALAVVAIRFALVFDTTAR